MKNLIHLTGILLCIFYQAGNINAQPPQSIPYQAVVRDSTGNALTNHAITLRFVYGRLSLQTL